MSAIPEPYKTRIISMYQDEPQIGSDGQLHSLKSNSRVLPAQGEWLYQLCVSSRAERTLEIGLACGYSTVFFLAAIATNGTGQHTALDPFQEDWKGIGRMQAQTLGVTDRFTWKNELSVPGLVHLGDRGETFDIIFIDGSHRFDDALVDFTLAVPLCRMGGTIILDDLWMPSIRRVTVFLRRNRPDFEELPTPIGNVVAFRRIATDDRDWRHYAHFSSPWQDLRLKLRAALFHRRRS